MSETPIEITFLRWKHKERGYIVEVTQVINNRGKHGYHTVVFVHDKNQQRAHWPATVFIKTFEPYGRRKRAVFSSFDSAVRDD